jgi:hypothetical protein
MNHEIPEDIHLIIEAKVYLLGESSNFFVHIPGISKSTFTKKHRAK